VSSNTRTGKLKKEGRRKQKVDFDMATFASNSKNLRNEIHHSLILAIFVGDFKELKILPRLLWLNHDR
jgi:hypothetical protein